VKDEIHYTSALLIRSGWKCTVIAQRTCGGGVGVVGLNNLLPVEDVPKSIVRVAAIAAK
jgi:hypothetical protein